MEEKLFVIAIGGTGMRCLESFVHMCAIGMFDGKEINILTLDTDYANGNKGRVEQLIDLYNRVKSDGGVEGGANAGTFFSAKLKLFKFFTDYSNQARRNFNLLSAPTAAGLPNSDEIEQDDRDLADLFFDPNVQEFNLEHGYRAQTHLGSLLMYHGIVEAMKAVVENRDKAQPHQRDLAEFVRALVAEPNARVFVFGSVFGGTGASSIPIIPKALKDAASLDNAMALNLDNVKFGSTLLTQYFSFNPPDRREKEREKVIATSDNFAINSQAALQFYQADPTVKKYYKRFYHIGWPESKRISYSGGGNTITGGGEQKNNCHIVELMCACAAYDFFNLDANSLNNDEVEYVYRCVEEKDNAFIFNGKSFVDNESDLLANKLGIMFSFAHIALSLNGAATMQELGTKSFIRFLDQQNIRDYNALTDDQTSEIDNYLKYFAYDVNTKREIVPGWIYQLHTSVGSGQFIFKNSAFEENVRRLERIDPGDLFFDEKHKWGHSLLGSSYNTLGTIMATESSCRPNEEAQHVHTVKEKFLAHIYKSIAKAQHFEQI